MPAGRGIPVSAMTNRQLAIAVPLVFLIGIGNVFLFGYAFTLEWAGPQRLPEMLGLALTILFFVVFVAVLEIRFLWELFTRWRGKRPG